MVSPVDTMQILAFQVLGLLTTRGSGRAGRASIGKLSHNTSLEIFRTIYMNVHIVYRLKACLC